MESSDTITHIRCIVRCHLHHFCGCEWTGQPEDMMEHCMAKHGRFVRKGNKQKYKIEKFCSINILKDFPHIIQAHGSLFLIWLQKYPSGMMSLRAYCLECCINRAKYAINIILQNKIEITLYPSHHEYNYYWFGHPDPKFTINVEKYVGDAEDLSYRIIIEDKSLQTLLESMNHS